MLPLEKQVCSLELAKKLKELNCKQESAFYWINAVAGNLPNGLPDSIEGQFLVPKIEAVSHGMKFKEGFQMVAAFTVAELGEMLPEYYPSCKHDRRYECMDFHGKQPEIGKMADTEANARAAMLVYLIEHGIVKP